jgi:hypothetical protein
VGGWSKTYVRNFPGLVGVCNVGELTVHVVLGFHQLASVSGPSINGMSNTNTSSKYAIVVRLQCDASEDIKQKRRQEDRALRSESIISFSRYRSLYLSPSPCE